MTPAPPGMWTPTPLPTSCQPGAEPGPTPLMKLTTIQYRNTVRDLLAASGAAMVTTEIRDLLAAIPEDSTNGFRGMDNRVTLNRQGEIVLSYRRNNEEGHRRLVARLKTLMQRQSACREHGHECHQGLFARNLFVGERIPLAGVAHQNGTIRFGDDPRTSALDVHCRAHDLDNLYVVDGSFFPSSAAVNPALTIMANALRVGDHLKERMA